MWKKKYEITFFEKFQICFCSIMPMSNIIVILAERAQNIEISIAKENPGNWSMVAYKEGEMGPLMSLKFDPVQARYVRVTLRNKQTQFHLCEVEVYGYK
jgi:hypothetical protein